MLAAQQLLGNTMPVTLSPELDEGKEWGWINFRQNSRHRVWCGWGGGGRDLLVVMIDSRVEAGGRGIAIHQNLHWINHESLLNSKGVIIFWSVCSTFNNMVEVRIYLGILDVWLISMRSHAISHEQMDQIHPRYQLILCQPLSRWTISCEAGAESFNFSLVGLCRA